MSNLASEDATAGLLSGSVALPYLWCASSAVLAAGALLLVTGASAFASRWDALALGLTHVGTLGFVTMACMGFVWLQLPRERGWRNALPPAVCALLVLGLAGLLAGFQPSLPSVYIALLAWAPRKLTFQAYTQFTGDLLVITGLVYQFGGASSPL